MKYEDMIWDKWNEDEEEYNDSNGNLKINNYLVTNGDSTDEKE